MTLTGGNMKSFGKYAPAVFAVITLFAAVDFAVTLAARDLVGVITIAAGGATGTYSFASYSLSVWDDNDAALKNILTATYAYGKSAKA